MDEVADVDIEADGVYKYILIQVSDKKISKMVVRGYSWADYHGKCCCCLLDRHCSKSSRVCISSLAQNE